MKNQEKFRHIPSGTLVAADKFSKDGKYFKTRSEAKFAIAECEKWEPDYPQLAIAMPPAIGHVVASGDHVFVVVHLSRFKETLEPKLWYEWDKDTNTGKFYAMSQCQLIENEVEKRLIDGWARDIARCAEAKETSAHYQNFIKLVPPPIRDLCVIRAMDITCEPLPPTEEKNGFF